VDLAPEDKVTFSFNTIVAFGLMMAAAVFNTPFEQSSLARVSAGATEALEFIFKRLGWDT
jgi:hypothetical protein